MEILFKNQTITSEESLRKIEKYTKSYIRYIINIVKISICIFIILVSLVLLKNIEFIALIYILFAIWGIKDTILKISKKVKIETIIYEFYEPYFIAKTPSTTLKIGYNEIKAIKEDDNNYYIIFHTRCGIFLDKNCFSIGDKSRKSR